MSETPLITFQGVGKTYDDGRTWAVQDVSFDVAAGETVALLGSSGSGKTTLLKTVNQLVRHDAGEVRVGGDLVAESDPVALRRGIGYVFQSIGLFPHLRVRENVATVPRLLGWSKERQVERIDELLDLIGLPPADFADRFPDELSGGQRQRVGFARALAADPELLLMDEPFGALDAVVREQLQQEVVRITRSLGKTILLVTHDLFEALTVAERIGVMHNGRLEQIGTAEELLGNPATDFVRSLVERPRELVEQFGTLMDGKNAGTAS